MTPSREDQLFWLSVSNLWSPKEARQKLDALGLRDRIDWNACDAQRARQVRVRAANQLRCRKHPDTARWVIQKLKEHWSPEQIAGRSKIDGPQTVSHEYVYLLVKADKQRGGGLHRHLKRFRKRKQRFNNRLYSTGPIIPNRVGIEQRPKIVDRRNRLGDLEADLILGYRSSGYILSVVDRKSKYTILRKLKTKRKAPPGTIAQNNIAPPLSRCQTALRSIRLRPLQMAKTQAQYQFKAFKDFTRSRHGGGERKGKRKLARPIATKAPMHLVLRASKAKGTRSMLRVAHFSNIQATIYKYGAKHDVQIQRYANVGNHLHLLIKAKTKKGFQRFLKTITGLIARMVMGSKKGQPQGKFWDELAFTRIVSPGRDLKTTQSYILQNLLEAYNLPTKRKAGDPSIIVYGQIPAG